MAKGKFPKWIKVTLLSVSGIIALVIVATSIILSKETTTRLVNKYADEFLDANLEFGSVKVSLLRHFPSVSLELTDASLTYPSERFERYEKHYRGNRMVRMGKGETVDTLASFRKLTAATNVVRLLGGEIDVRLLELSAPRIFAKQYGDTTANWNIFSKISSTQEEEEDTTENKSFFNKVNIRKVSLTEKPLIVFCSTKDDLYSVAGLKDMTLNARISDKDILSSEIGLDIDKLFLAGRYETDTITFSMNQLGVKLHKRRIKLNLESALYYADKEYGRHKIPLEVKAMGAFPVDTVPSVALRHLSFKLLGMEAKGHFNASLYGKDHCYVDAALNIPDYKLGDLADEYLALIAPSVKDLKTNALLSVSAKAHGVWWKEKGEFPELSASIDIPRSQLSNSSSGESLDIELHAKGSGTEKGVIDASIDTLSVVASGLSIGVNASASDLLGGDPLLGAKLNALADLSHAKDYLPDDIPFSGSGTVSAKVDGMLKLSQANIASIANAPINAEIYSDSLRLSNPADTLDAYVQGLDVRLASTTNKFDRNYDESRRMLQLTCRIDSVNATMAEVAVRVKDFFVGTQNDPSIMSAGNAAKTVAPFSGIIKIGSAALKSGSELSVFIKDNVETYRITSDRKKPEIPVLSVASKNGTVALRSGTSRAFGKNLNVKAEAVMVPPDKKAGETARNNKRFSREGMPDWLKEEDFRKSDIDIKLSEDAAKWFNRWNFNGNLDIKRISVATPMFPLRTSVSNVKAKLTNNELKISNLSVRSGRSNITANADVKGLRRALTKGGMLRANVFLTSKGINANELLAAIAKGQETNAADAVSMATNENIDNEEFENMVVSDTLEAADTHHLEKLIVIPANLDADVKIDARNILWSKLQIKRLSSNIKVSERCLQVASFDARSDVGNIDFSAFYATKTKEDIKCGFSLAVDNVTAEKVIEVVPQLDTLVPLLKSFSGNLNCAVAATSELDTAMNIKGPTMEGVFRISGRKLALAQNKEIKKITTLLMFKDKKQASIDTLCIDGVLSGGKLEIFPCILDIDRYRLAMSGIQNMNASFRYHVSVLKAPLWIRLGVDLYGDNFDDINFHLGKAKYHNGEIPIFTEVVDTVQINLRSSIRDIFQKGVNKAIEENNVTERFERSKRRTGYKNMAETPLDTLTKAEQARLKSEE